MQVLTKEETLRRRAVVSSKKNNFKGKKVDKEKFYDSVERIYALCDQLRSEIREYKDEDIVFETR